MADSTVTEEEILEDEDVETPQGEDETPEAEESAEVAEETEELEEFQRRFTQFKGETPEEYAKNLEDAYGHSTTEAVRLAQQIKEKQLEIDRIMAQVAKDPQLASQIMEQQPAAQQQQVAPPANLDPALIYARQTMEQQMEKEYHTFVADHRDMETNPELNKQVIENLSAVSEAYRVRTGKIIPMREGLTAAWVMAGQPLTDTEEATRMAVKNTAAQTKSSTGRPTAPPEKPLFTKAQLDFARRAYPDKSEEELVETLSQYTP